MGNGAMSSHVDDARRQARYRFDAAEYQESLEAARAGLDAAPDDVELLVLAGRAGVECDDEGAVEHLRRASELAPGEAHVWHHYGEALAADGRTDEADAAFRRTVELDPSDQVALSNLGHTALATGHSEEGLGFLERAADIAHAGSTAMISLVDMYRSFGQFEAALAQARTLAESLPDDPLATLDVAELSLHVGQFDEAMSAFSRLRDLDDIPGHEVYPLHGMIQVEIKRDDFTRARELAAQATTIEPHGLGSDLTAFLEAQTGGTTDGEAPTAAEVQAALVESLTSYRKMLADDRRLTGEVQDG
jgi:Flp pilus assembly protein TadD